MNEVINKLLNTLPEKPGCYQMYDNNDNVIYIGKAKNLKIRVSQYFLNEQFGKVKAMVNNISYFNFIITNNEIEAFLLEYNLIKKYYPKYNIQLKDDKHYPYIAVKNKNQVEVKLTRNIKNKNYTYFGPYPKSAFATSIINLINTIFPTKKCKIMPRKPCIYYHINQCLGYCFKEIEDSINNQLFNDIISFLKGKTNNIEIKLKNEIKKYNDLLNFEESLKNKKILDSINYIKECQTIDFNKTINRDYFAFSSFNGYVCLSIFIYRNGMLMGKDDFIYEIFDDELNTVVNLILQYYEKNEAPKEINVSSKKIKENLIKYKSLNVKVPLKGKNFDIIVTLLNNSKISLEKHLKLHIKNTNLNDALVELKKLLKVESTYYIELFDNSHISGYDAVGVSVAFINGIGNKKLYRKYNINNSNKQSDIENMKEVLFRKYSRMLNENQKLPDIILLDGGITQLNIGLEVLNTLNLNIKIFGLYKNSKHQTEGIIDENKKKYLIPKNSNVYHLISSMQSEVHRFAITTFRNKHLKSYKNDILSNIKGLGEIRKKLIYDIYPNLDSLKNASIEELEQILDKKIARLVYERIKLL